VVTTASHTGSRAVGRYAIYDEIASGGMASVHFARLFDAAGGAKTVAVKRAHPHLARENDFALMFLDEARLASRIHHPNVVPTIDVLQTPNDLALVMDYVHGESLFRLVRAARERGAGVPRAIAASILVGALHGLHAAHDAVDERGAPLNLVHRDVSPHNILVGVDGIARIVDFGIAKAAGRLHSTRDSSVKGKYAYMAPEQVHGEHVSRLTDTYAAAIVFWELLTGERLFSGKSDAETIHKCLVARVQPPSRLVADVGAKLDAVVLRGLSRDPAARYPTARAMADDIAAIVTAIERQEVGAQDAAGVAPVTAHAPMEEPTIATPVRRARGAAPTVLASIAVAGTIVALASRHAPAEAPSPAATLVHAPAPPAAPAPAPTPAPLPGASAEPAPPPSAAPASDARPKPGASTRAPSHTAAPARSRAKRKACDPPYSIDADGKQIFKPECM
jgi:serine/threonine-protein kinase